MKGKIDSYLKAAQRGSEWLVSNQQEDGSITAEKLFLYGIKNYGSSEAETAAQTAAFFFCRW